MADSYIWGNLNRATNDPTLIDEAIGEALVAHNDDPDAHLGPGKALESHRAAEIIDHRAESVVNDKIHQFARTYVAIVGSGVEGDFDTIQSAIEYANNSGGGTVFVAPGTYYLSGQIEMKASVNLAAMDEDSVTIIGGYTAGNYIRIVDDIMNPQRQQFVENITFQTTGGGVFYNSAGDISNDLVTIFNFCSFTGGGKYIYNGAGDLRFNDCFFECNSIAALSLSVNTMFLRCNVARHGTSTTARFIDCIAWGDSTKPFRFMQCVLDMSAATTVDYIGGAGECFIDVDSSRFIGWSSNNSKAFITNIKYSHFTFKNNHNLSFSSDGAEGVIIGNTMVFFGTGRLDQVTTELVFIGNNIIGSYAGFPAGTRVYGDQRVQPYMIHYAATTAMALATNQVAQLTPNSTRTLSTTVPLAGQYRTLVIHTSGTTSYTLTFGSGFKTAGTLATGATTARKFVISFVSDGTNLVETGRTVAMAQ